MKILDCKAVATSIQKKLIKKIKDRNLKPSIIVFKVGNNGSDQSYINGLTKTFDELGIKVIVIECDSDMSNTEFENLVSHECKKYDAGFIVLDSEKKFESFMQNEMIAYDVIDDLDCSCRYNLSRMMVGKPVCMPCTAEAVLKIMEYYNINPKGLDVTIVGRSNRVGKPLSVMLTGKDATVTLCHSKTYNLKKHLSNAHIIISAIGDPTVITEQELVDSYEPIIIDVGINYYDGKICGDINEDIKYMVASEYTPVPGGVGAVTNTILAEHVVDRAIIKKIMGEL